MNPFEQLQVTPPELLMHVAELEQGFNFSLAHSSISAFYIIGTKLIKSRILLLPIHTLVARVLIVKLASMVQEKKT